MKRGEVYNARLEPVEGSEPGGTHDFTPVKSSFKLQMEAYKETPLL
jgi:mRNA-degrading endonuclease toxin of MazEF toxin-antitoxin module